MAPLGASAQKFGLRCVRHTIQPPREPAGDAPSPEITNTGLDKRTKWVADNLSNVMKQNTDATDATFTEYLPAADNADPSIDGPARITHVRSTHSWLPDDGEELDDDPEAYYVECDECGDTFEIWASATEHAENDH